MTKEIWFKSLTTKYENSEIGKKYLQTNWAADNLIMYFSPRENMKENTVKSIILQQNCRICPKTIKVQDSSEFL